MELTGYWHTLEQELIAYCGMTGATARVESTAQRARHASLAALEAHCEEVSPTKGHD